MAAIPHERPATRWSWITAARDVWASLAISVIWAAVMFDAIFGPDIRTVSAGGDSTSVPSAVAISFFAVLATWFVARYGFDRNRD
jgi:hypothetical protein